jgi:hypothetical protein
MPDLCVNSETGEKLLGEAAVARCIELEKECGEFQHLISLHFKSVDSTTSASMMSYRH